MGLFQLGVSVASLLWEGWRHKAFIERWHKPILQQICADLDYEPDARERKRMFFIYPWYVPVFCAPLFVSLKGRSASSGETKRLCLTASMACICDDLIDEEGFSHRQVMELLAAPANAVLPSKRAMLLVRLFDVFKKEWPVNEAFMNQLRLTLEWVAKSADQQNPDITLEEIIEITRRKNGHTFLLLARVIDAEWSEKELDYIYQSAGLVQFGNDCLDLYVDTQNGINTYFNRAENVAQSRSFFLSEFLSVKRMVETLMPDNRYRRKALHRMSMLQSFALTALDQFQEVEDRHGPEKDWKDIPRKELIVDLEIFRNQLRTLRNLRYLSKV